MNPITGALERMKPGCAVCGRKYHRYSTGDAEHRFDAVACVNGLLKEIEELERHHEEHHEQPTRCEYDVGKYLHGGLSICVSCRVELEKKFTIAREALEEIKRVGKDPHVTIAKEALERIK